MTENDNPTRFHVTYAQFEEWERNVWPKDKKRGIRLGQSYFNHFSEFQHPKYKGQPFPELFYQDDNKRAKELVYSCTDFIDYEG